MTCRASPARLPARLRPPPCASPPASLLPPPRPQSPSPSPAVARGGQDRRDTPEPKILQPAPVRRAPVAGGLLGPRSAAGGGECGDLGQRTGPGRGEPPQQRGEHV